MWDFANKINSSERKEELLEISWKIFSLKKNERERERERERFK